MGQSIRLAWREILHNKVFSFLFLINVAVGLLGLITIENFKVSFQTVLAGRAKNLLGADLSLSSRFPINDLKRSQIKSKLSQNGAQFTEAEGMSMFSMAKGNRRSRLVFLETLGDGAEPYPFYGHLEIDKRFKFPREQRALPEKGSIWVYPEVISQLGGEKLDKLTIGSIDFKVAGVVTDDTQQTFEMGSVAPKVFIREDDARDAGLIQKGSTIRYYYYIKTNTALTKPVIDEIIDLVDDNAVRVSTPEKSSEQVGRVLAYLSDFLGLVSLVALFLASVGLFYLYRSHLGSKRLTFAIYSSIGLPRSSLFKIYLVHVFILGALGSLLGLGLGALIIPGLNSIITYVLPFPLPDSMSPKAFLMGCSVGILGVLLLSYPLILSAIRLRPASLFQEVAEMRSNDSRLSLIHFLPYGLFFCGMTFYASNSLKVGGAFLGLFFGAALLCFPIGVYLLKLGEKLSHSASLKWKLSLRYMNRYRVSTISIFLSLLLGSMLLNLIPLLQQSIQAEISMEKRDQLPSLFLFDIQDEQVADLRSFFDKSDDQGLLSLSPFIRSRIVRINEEEVKVDKDKALTREEEREQRFRNRGTNLSYRDTLSEAETLIDGVPFPGPFEKLRDGLPLISIEARYADRMGIEMGDELEFNVLGIPVVGRVWNIRKVRWTSFLPNFFIQFQSGVLDDAPKTWLAAVPRLKEEKKEKIQEELYENFPNVSAVDISRVVDKILSVMNQMGWALKAMSILCLVVGFFVLYSLSNHQMNQRKMDLVLLKVIGMDFSSLKSMVRLEFTGIGFIASSLGASFGMVMSFIVSSLFFDGLWVFAWGWPLGSTIVITLLCYVTSSWGTKKALEAKASAFL